MTSAESLGNWSPAAAGPAGAWPMRMLRATVFAVAGLGLAVCAHRLAGGLLPGVPALAAAALGLFAVALVASKRERVGWQIAGLVGATQAAVHAAFAYAPAGHAAGGQNWAKLLFCQHGEQPVSAQTVAAARAHLSGGAMDAAMSHSAPVGLAAAAMLAVHVVAAAAMAWWLRKGERTAWAAVRRVVSRLTRVADGPALVVTRCAQVFGDVWAPVRRAYEAGLAGRGPPALVLA